MLRLITNEKEIQACQKKIETQLKKDLPFQKTAIIGFQGGQVTREIVFKDKLWYSTDVLKDNTPRFWNAFGFHEKNQKHVNITVEINIVFEGRTKRVAGLVAKDERTGKCFLLHRGKIGGGKKGVGRDSFKNWYRGTWVEVIDDHGNEEEAILISSITSRIC
ncbi:MAG: hypothetical protein Q9P14_17050 [candidate division KSB1 bacterium]|nr:hypothetical protein [candidate division KSB1 bacterium]